MSDLVQPPGLDDERGLRGRSIRGAAVTSAAQACKFVLTFGSQVALARLLQPADFGLVAMVTPIIAFVQVFADLGLLQAIVQRPDVTPRQIDAAFWITAAGSLGLTLLMIAASPLLAWMYGEPRVAWVASCLALLVLLTGLSLTQAALLNRRMRFVSLAVIDVASVVGAVVVGVSGALLGLGYWSLVLSQAAHSVTGLAATWLLSDWRPRRPARGSGVMPLLRFGGNITVSNLAAYLNQTLDSVMIGVVLGKQDLGLYDRAWKLVTQPIGQLVAPVGRVSVPALSRLAAHAERYRAAFVQILQVMLVVTTPGFACAMMRADPLILFLFGPQWAGAADVFAWFSLGAIVTPVNITLFWLFISQGRAREHMIWSCATTAISVCAYAAGLPWGLEGVARTSVLSVYLVQSPLLAWAATRSGPVDLPTALRAVFPVAVAGLAAVAALEAVEPHLSSPRALDLLGSLAVSYLAMLGALAALPSGRTVLRAAWSVPTMLLHKGG